MHLVLRQWKSTKVLHSSVLLVAAQEPVLLAVWKRVIPAALVGSFAGTLIAYLTLPPSRAQPPKAH